MIQTLRDFLVVAERKGMVFKISETVFLEDLPEIIEGLLKREKILLFEKLAHYDFRVITNLVPSHEVFKIVLDSEDPYSLFLSRLNDRLKPEICSPTVGYSHIDTTHTNIRDIIPLLKHYEQDSAPFITTGIISAMDPETGVIARGIHRMGWRGGNRFGIALLNPPLKDVYPKYSSKKVNMPVSVAIGVDPLLFLSMALKVPAETDKLEVSGGIRACAIKAMESFQNRLMIPFEPELILEGYVSCEEGEPDGTLGEISGYPLTFGNTPNLFVTSVYYKPSPIYHALLPTSPEADSYLTFVSRAHIGRDLKRLFPFVYDIVFVRKSFGSSVIISIHEAEKDLIRSLIVFCLSFPMIKKVIVVDDDIAINDMKEVEWALITRCRFEEDIILIPGLKSQPIDPTQVKDYGVAKIGFNATKKGKNIRERVTVQKGDRDRVKRILEKFGGTDE